MGAKWLSEPPATHVRRGRYDWPAIAAKLRENPGKWLLVEDDEGNSRSGIGLGPAIRRGKIAALRDDENFTYEVTTRNNNPQERTAEVYVSAHPREEN